MTRRANRKKRLTVLYIVEHPNQEGDTCIDWTSQYCWTNGWNCLWRGHSVYRNRPLIPRSMSGAGRGEECAGSGHCDSGRLLPLHPRPRLVRAGPCGLRWVRRFGADCVMRVRPEMLAIVGLQPSRPLLPCGAAPTAPYRRQQEIDGGRDAPDSLPHLLLAIEGDSRPWPSPGKPVSQGISCCCFRCCCWCCCGVVVLL